MHALSALSWLQVFAQADEMCSGPDLWTCDFITVMAAADMTESRPPRASDAAGASDRVPVSPLVAEQQHAATAAKKEAAEPGALVQELTGKEQEPHAHKPKVNRTSCFGMPCPDCSFKLLTYLFKCPATPSPAEPWISIPVRNARRPS